MQVGTQIEGLRELRQQFSRLGERQQRTVLSAAIRDAGKLVVKRAKHLVRVRSRRLWRSLGVRTRTRRGDITASVGNVKRGGSHAHLVEKGTTTRVRRSGGSTGHMPASPFLRPALDENRRRIEGIVAEGIRKHIDRVAARGRRR
jgi:HK97 gp10 family phage protein